MLVASAARPQSQPIVSITVFHRDSILVDSSMYVDSEIGTVVRKYLCGMVLNDIQHPIKFTTVNKSNFLIELIIP